MKTRLIGIAAIAALLGTPAFAAEMPVKAPPPAPIYDWTGFYVGLNGGYSWGNSSTAFDFVGYPAFSGSQNLDGWLFGGQAGYNWQFNPNWLVGVEADLQATGQQGSLDPALGPVCTTTVPVLGTSITTCTSGTYTFLQSLPWFGTARARLGYLPSNNWLLYVTGGAAFGEVKTNVSLATSTTTTIRITGDAAATTTASAAGSASATRLGWTVGAGTEWVISGPWTAKLEYLYVDLGDVGNTFSVAGVPFLVTTSHVTDNILRVGLNYQFGGPH